MSKNDKKELVPELRFPEFHGEWQKKELGRLSRILRGGSPRPIDEFITNESSGLNWLKIADVNKNSKYVISTKEKVLVTALSKTREVHPGDLIMSNSMSFGRPYILKIKSCIHDGWIAITEIDEKIYRDYLYYLILSPTSQAYFLANAAGSGVQNLNADIIKLLPISFSDRTEQQKIADCLSSLDELITAHTQKHQELQSYKKGLLQNLFPAEGETVPALRFPEFENAGNWEEKLIGEIGEVVTGNTPSTSNRDYYGGNIMFASPADISERRFVSKTSKTLSSEGLDIARKIPAHSILFVCIGSTIGKVAQNAYECATNQQINAIIPLDEYENSFVYYALDFHSSEIAELAGKQAVPIINKTLFSSSVLIVPPEKGEQQKIADCLSSLDEVITAQELQIEVLKAHKKGLMQRLFPAVGEVL